jgi:hypothetical protein
MEKRKEAAMETLAEKEVTRHRVLFGLLTEGLPHWKGAFEKKFVLAQKEYEPPLPKAAVKGLAQELTAALEFFHGGEVTLEIETLTAKPYAGKAAAYWHFDGWTLTVGTTGYQG